MTVFKTFLKILNKNKFIIILYTVLLLVFGGLNMSTSENNVNFVSSKPSIYIVNYDEEVSITEDLIKYMKKNCKYIELDESEDAINDAIFYRDVNYVIYIPEGYHDDFFSSDMELNVKSAGDYQASLAEMMLKRYINVANIYKKSISDVKELLKEVNKTLNKKGNVVMTSKVDKSAVDKASFYFNFESYSILACLIYVICIVSSSFNNEKIRKRTVISSTSYKKNNRLLLLSNCLYSTIVWLFYLILSWFLIGKIMFTSYGLVYMLNSFLFTLCATTMALFIGSLVQNKNAISGIVNVVALGSSFLCGAFVPLEMLPTGVLNIAHALPTYYYIKSNNLLTTMESISFSSMRPIFINMFIIILFSFFFIILNNIVVNKKES